MARARLGDPAWLRRAFSDLGLKEIRGRRHNARVLEMFAISGHPGIKRDEIAWCSAAMNTWIVEAGYKGTGSLAARSWQHWGRKLDIKKPLPRGAILIFRRGNSSWQGHVTILLEDHGSYVNCIGGNQRNSVCISRYSKRKLIGAVWPEGAVMDFRNEAPDVTLYGMNEEPLDELSTEPTLLQKASVGAGIVSTSAGAFAGLSDWRIAAVIVVGLIAAGIGAYVAYRLYRKNRCSV